MDADFLISNRADELVLLLGSNMGNKVLNLNEAIRLLTEEFGVPTAISSIYETEPWGNTNQDIFVNQAIAFNCRIKPMIVMETILGIEQKLGRERFEKWGPRLIDIDIIFYGQLMFQSDHLEIPHPYMHDRLFVLGPLCEIAPNYRHPMLNLTVSQLKENLIKKEGK